MKIISDGKSSGTKVFTDSGEEIGRIQSIHVYINANEPFAKCKLEILVPQTDIIIKNENVKEVLIQASKEEQVKEEQERVY